MKCPYCYQDKNKVTGFRKSYESEVRGQIIRRQRVCLNCGKKFYTFESVKLEEEGKK